LRVLITGGTGFIGANLAYYLVARHEEVVLFDSQPNIQRIAPILDNVKLLRGDLAVVSDLLDAVRQNRPDIIFHLGAILSAEAERRPMHSYAVNFDGTINVLEASRVFDVGQVIYPSSIAAFGPDLPQPVGDDMPQRPTTVYGISKVFGELWGEWYNKKFGLDFRALRLPSVVGPGRGPGGASAFSTMIIESAARGLPYEIDVDEEATIPILYVKDAVRALLMIAEAETIRRRTYNIAGISPTARELVDEVKKHIPDAHLVFFPKKEIMEIVRSWPRSFDDTPARKDWGWEAEYPLSRLVEDFLRQVRSNLLGARPSQIDDRGQMG